MAGDAAAAFRAPAAHSSRAAGAGRGVGPLVARAVVMDYLQVASARILANWDVAASIAACASLQDALERGAFLRNEYVSIVVDYGQQTSL